MTPQEQNLFDTLRKADTTRSFWYQKQTLREAAGLLSDTVAMSELSDCARQARVSPSNWIQAVRALAKTNGHIHLPAPETGTTLMAASIPKPAQLFHGLLHEGLLLFGGKSKRGKSWMMLDLALSLAVGRAGFQHFACDFARPVLYLALEDGRARLQGRLKKIQPNLTQADNLHFLYRFPALHAGGVEQLIGLIETYHYGLVVIDVLARMEQSGAAGELNYHEVYEQFAPLQDFREQHHFALAMLTHLRKQEAEDVFDTLRGSVGYQGAQDVLWVLERKPDDDIALLHVRDKDAEDKSIALNFNGECWTYLGEGEHYTVSKEQKQIMDVLLEEKGEMDIPSIMRACEMPQEKYGHIRKVLMMMVRDDLIYRTRHGRYSATLRGSLEFGVSSREERYPGQEDDMGF